MTDKIQPDHFGHQPNHLLSTLLTTISDSIIPLTQPAVERGCKVFGASILRKSDLTPVVSSTNDEITSPLLHGEVATLLSFHSFPSERKVDPKQCIFLSTHEPCSLCLSAITWSGFDNFYYLFTYADTKQKFAIPHDIRILEQVFGDKDGKLYNKNNAFWNSYSLGELAEQSPKAERDELRAKMEKVKKEYDSLSDTYQAQKSSGVGSIPLA